ncbi:hypothetical protein GCM10008905_33210 [Clostridium malenominatum]|uniref:DUF2680 domain-containing protein n=1 Tax=Clostridium malenominatum TaxID=1539 RepID=A0ABN1J7H0_9CLOT
MKKRTIIATLALTLTLGLGVTAYASTTAPENTNNTAISSNRRIGMGRMMNGGSFGYDMMTSLLKNKLNMTDDEIKTALTSGKTMWQIAEEKGISQEDFKKAMLEERTKAIDEAITNGKITKEEGDALKERVNTNIENCTLDGENGLKGNRGFGGMMGNGRGKGGRGCGGNL